MFCVECGAEGEVIDGLCRDCMMKKGGFVEVPPNVDVLVCAHCGSMQTGNRWSRVDDVVRKAVEGAIRVSKGATAAFDMDIEEEDERNVKVRLTAHVRKGDFAFEVPLETRVRVKAASCRDCSRQRGSYYEAILQVRARKRLPTEDEMDAVASVLEEVISGEGSFVTRAEDVRGGTDIYLGKVADGRAVANTLMNRFGATVTETKSQAGRKDGKDIYRTTFLVRFPEVGVGDMVPMEGSMFVVRSFNKAKVNLEDISEGTRTTRPMKDLDPLPIVRREGAIRDTVVVSEQGDDLQVMHPDSYRTVDIRRPSLFRPGTKEVKVVTFEDDIFLYLL